MNAPFFKFEYFNSDVSLIIAFAIGIAFGFALEKGGFVRVIILASLFYFTNMLPMVVGGLVAGVGFVIGGYCPGTSMVAVATGKIDAVFYVVGMIFGIFVFGEMFPSIENFFNSGFMGHVTIPSYFNLSYGLVVFLVVLMAIGAFAAAEWGEKKMSAKSGKAKT